MPDVITAFAPRNKRNARRTDDECVVQAHAELVSLGGAILLALCMFLAAAFIAVSTMSNTTPIQRFIVGILLFASLAYLINSVTEKLMLQGRTLVFDALLSSKREIPLDDLEGMILTHEGFNLEKGIVTIEFRQYDRKPDKVSLGPCWQRSKLEAFMRSIQKVLRGESDKVKGKKKQIKLKIT
jgi:hypothetical protein